MSHYKKTHIFVIGNEKGGAGKTTCSIHLITGLLYKGYKVISIDVDTRQQSLSNYLINRDIYNSKNPANKVIIPTQHYTMQEGSSNNIEKKEKEEEISFTQILNKSYNNCDYIVIDTPGSYTYLSRLAHSYADTVITPINDSFLDLDVIAKIKDEHCNNFSPSIYSQMLWEQKMEKAARDKGSINWILMRNRLSSINANNKIKIHQAIKKIAKRIAFSTTTGFSERVIFKELFFQGLTLDDLPHTCLKKTLNISHIAAREELRVFLDAIGVMPSKSLLQKNQ